MEAADPSPWKKLDPSKLRREAEAKGNIDFVIKCNVYLLNCRRGEA